VMLFSQAMLLRNRLFPLQMRYLAIADLGFVLFAMPVVLTEWDVLHVSNETFEVVCKWDKMVMSFWRHLSLWIEMHIAVSFVCETSRIRRSLFMYHSLPYLCLPCLALTLISVSAYPWRFDRHERVCQPVHHMKLADPVSVADFALCACICSVCYVAMVCRSRSRDLSHSVQARVCSRAEMYILNALVTYLPMFVLYLHPTLFNNDLLYAFAAVLEMSGGLLNTLSYALRSRYATALRGGPSTIRQHVGLLPGRMSFVVEVNESESTVREFVEGGEGGSSSSVDMQKM